MERACVESFSGSSAGEQDVDTRCRKVYYDTARDVLGLFRAIAPLVKAQEIDQVHHACMHACCSFFIARKRCSHTRFYSRPSSLIVAWVVGFSPRCLA